MRKYTFIKEERLCNKRLINGLFESGSSFVVYPFRVLWKPLRDAERLVTSPVQVIISVPKRRFRRSVDRNRIKRQMREVYRLHKEDELYSFLLENSVRLDLAIQYIGKEQQKFPVLQRAILRVFNRLKDEIAKMDLG